MIGKLMQRRIATFVRFSHLGSEKKKVKILKRGKEEKIDRSQPD
jgi:hypothetical protein